MTLGGLMLGQKADASGLTQKISKETKMGSKGCLGRNQKFK
jgi:hypothetical protein